MSSGMRIRTVKPEFWTNIRMAKQKAETRLLAIALLNWADDEGYFLACPMLIRGALFPYENNQESIVQGLIYLEEIGYLKTCVGNNDTMLGHIVSFKNHQKISHANNSTLKPLWNDAPKFTEGSVKAHGVLTVGMEGNGREWNGRGIITAQSQTAAIGGESLFSENGNSPSIIKPEPKKKREKQPIGYNVVEIYCTTAARGMRSPVCKIMPNEVQMLIKIARIYSKDEFIAMLKAYESHMLATNLKAGWKVWDIYSKHTEWRRNARVSGPDPSSDEELEKLMRK